MIIKKVKLSEIVEPKLAMRSEISQEQINELADSIMEIGLINPITLQKRGNKFEIIAGNCRFIACRQLQKTEIEATILEASEDALLQIRMDENIKRREVSEWEESMYLEAIMKQTGCNQTELANKLGKSASYVNERLAIMNYHPQLLKALKDGQISFSVAREFNRVKEVKHLLEFLRFALAEAPSPATARKWVANLEYEGRMRDDVIGESDYDASDSERAERAILGECNICGARIHQAKLRPIWACPDCKFAVENPSEDEKIEKKINNNSAVNYYFVESPEQSDFVD
jgi:ParB family chromosome partitioning protein